MADFTHLRVLRGEPVRRGQGRQFCPTQGRLFPLFFEDSMDLLGMELV